MKTFLEYSQLQEKLILFNHGSKYGQVVIMAGGAGSGKSFVVKNFIENDKFKVINVDDWKEAFLTLSRLQGQYKEIRHLSLGNPQDVSKLHQFIKDKGIRNKVFQGLFGSERNLELLPNILFDITGKNLHDIEELGELAQRAGYSPESIHILYVLTEWRTAYRRNLSRTRTIASQIFIETHRGATQTLQRILNNELPGSIDGRIDIVLNNPEESEFHKDSKVVKDFTYINAKREGHPINSDEEIASTVEGWLEKNAPKSAVNSTYRIEK